MNILLKIINPLEYKNWDELVLSKPGHSIFHSLAWAKVLHQTYGYIPYYFALIEKNELKVLIPAMEVHGIIAQRRGVSLPFSDYCEPIINKHIEFIDVLDSILRLGKKYKWRSIEFRDGSHFQQDIVPSSYFYRHTLSLSGNEDQIFSKFRSSTKRNIKKAIREGVQIEIHNSFESIKDYYQLHCLTRKKHGLPPQPFGFFANIYDHIITKNSGFVMLAFYNGKKISGGIYFHFGSEAMYKFGASDSRFQHLRANNLVMWEAIKWFARKGFKNFCFGKTEPENDGLLQYKRGWGTKESVIKYYKYDLEENKYIISDQKLKGFHNKIFSRIPISLLKMSGSLFYKYMG